MEYLFGWPWVAERPSLADLALPPPPFLSIHKGVREDTHTLTPLESQLKDMIVRLYSDTGNNSKVLIYPNKENHSTSGSPSTIRTTQSVKNTHEQLERRGDHTPESDSSFPTFELKLERGDLEPSITGANFHHTQAMSGTQPKPKVPTAHASYSVPSLFSADDTVVFDSTDPQIPSLPTSSGLPYLPAKAQTQNTLSLSLSDEGPGENNIPLSLRYHPSQRSPMTNTNDANTSYTWLPVYSHSDSSLQSARPRPPSAGGKPRSQVIESFQINPESLPPTTSSLPTSPLGPPPPVSAIQPLDRDRASRTSDLAHVTPPNTVLPVPVQSSRDTLSPKQETKDTNHEEPQEEYEKQSRSSSAEDQDGGAGATSRPQDGGIPIVSRLEDFETASTLSLHQLTESLQNEPPDLHSVADDLLIADGGTIPLPGGQGYSFDRERTPTPTGSTTMAFSPVSKHVTPSKYAPKRHPVQPRDTSSPSLPRHVQPSPQKSPFSSPFPRQSSLSSESSQEPATTPRRPRVALPDNPNDSEAQVKLLESQLTKAQQAKANLEGQLESIVEECKATLKDRAELQSKLAKTEAELAEANAKGRKLQSEPKAARNKDKEVGQVKAQLEQAQTAVEREQKALSALKNELAKEKQHAKRLQNELAEAQRTQLSQETTVGNLQKKVGSLQAKIDQKADESRELDGKLSSLQAGYKALEETKTWLHDQLQDTLESKMKLQEDIRDSKATTIAQSIKMDQLMKENAIFQQQIADLHKGVLQDKAKLVTELEAIEADVLSREDAYAQLVAEKSQLEDLLKMKEDNIEVLNSELATTQVAKDELEHQVDSMRDGEDDLALQVENLQQQKKTLKEKHQSVEQELDDKSSDVQELEKLKGTLQERLRQSEAALINMEGTVQGLNDAKDILKHELGLVKQARDTAERELDEVRQEAAELENKLKSTLDEGREKVTKIRALAQAHQLVTTENQALQAELTEKEVELAQKSAELSSLEDQSRDLMAQFQSLQDRFQSMAAESGVMHDGVAGKDHMIAHLSTEKEKAEEEVGNLKKSNEQLEKKLSQLQQEKAHLQGELEATSGSNLEELQKALQDKSHLQAELNSLKVSHQKDLIKPQARADRMESELKATRRDAGKSEKQLQKSLQAKEEELQDLQESKSQIEASLRDAQNKLKLLNQVVQDKVGAEGALKVFKDQAGNLQARNELLAKRNEELVEQLQQEASQKAEVERASGMVAMKLKQNAKEKEKNLQDQIRELSLEIEHLRGRLAGVSTTQHAMRDHTGALEVALAERESSLIKLSAQAQRVLQEKEMEDQAFAEQISNLEHQINSLRTQLEESKKEILVKKKQVDDLEREIAQQELKLATLPRSSSISTLEETVAQLSEAKCTIQLEVGNLKSQLVRAKTSTNNAQRDLVDKTSQVEILQRELELAKQQENQATEELKQLQEHLKLSEERHILEMENLKRAIGEGIRESSALDPARFRPMMFDSSISSIGLDEADNPSGMIITHFIHVLL